MTRTRNQTHLRERDAIVRERINQLRAIGKQLKRRRRRARKQQLERVQELTLRQQATPIGVDLVERVHVARQETLVLAQLVREQNLKKLREYSGYEL